MCVVLSGELKVEAPVVRLDDGPSSPQSWPTLDTTSLAPCRLALWSRASVVALVNPRMRQSLRRLKQNEYLQRDLVSNRVSSDCGYPACTSFPQVALLKRPIVGWEPFDQKLRMTSELGAHFIDITACTKHWSPGDQTSLLVRNLSQIRELLWDK
ncbi:hypothetical protein CONLIGDRAFT_53702 [Coniochaeta ligniaria NRRL 30616]|uniref:Uncharacterized protein n=1 Tax=Coniochaeta ligniaria NRRL 30616 TaxID=1408157 RepID=A0A1J7K522_9PEZI|nr:hypothetical protein CONLIGDRAFT_53702 [Coniochaeta ligniaria NRRL 30616]